MFFGMVEDDIKNRKWSLGQTGGVAGPETCKNCHLYRMNTMKVEYSETDSSYFLQDDRLKFNNVTINIDVNIIHII